MKRWSNLKRPLLFPVTQFLEKLCLRVKNRVNLFENLRNTYQHTICNIYFDISSDFGPKKHSFDEKSDLT